MSADTSTRLLQLDPLLEAKNPNVRNEAAAAFGKFSIFDEKVVNVLKKHLTAQNWDTRVSAGRALQAVLQNVQDIEIREENQNVTISSQLKDINVENVLKVFKPLLR